MTPLISPTQQDFSQKTAQDNNPDKKDIKPLAPVIKSKSPDTHSEDKKAIKTAPSPALRLREALEYWDVNAISSLLKTHPACVNDLDPETGQSALMTAVQKGQLEIIQHLLACDTTDINLKDGNGLTALHIAVKYNRERSFDALLAAGAEINTASISLRTPLMDAAQNGNAQMTCELLNKGAQKFINCQDMAGHTAAYAAASGGSNEVINFIARHGGDLNMANYQGVTPLIIAAHQGNTAAVKSLLKLGCPLAQISSNNFTALSAACKAGKIETVKLLIEKGAHKKKAGIDPVLCAAYTNQYAVITLLHENGVAIDLADNAGDTPLIAAAYLGKAEAVHVLLKCKADPQHRNISKKNALAAAIEGDQAETIFILLNIEREKVTISIRHLKKMVEIASELQDGRILDQIYSRKFFTEDGVEIMINPSWIRQPD